MNWPLIVALVVGTATVFVGGAVAYVIIELRREDRVRDDHDRETGA